MADFVHSLPRTQPSSKKSSNNNAFAANVYEDVFGGASKFGIPSFTSRVDDYSEIFSSYNSSSRGSSIPFLDLPVAVDDEADFGNVQCSEFDYYEIFGGFDSVDYAVPYEELFLETKAASTAAAGVEAESSSEDVWTPAETASPSEESGEDPVCSERDQAFPNTESHYAYDGMKQFNVSYHMTNQTSKEDGISGTTHIAELNAVPAYTFVVDEVLPLQAAKCNEPVHEVANDHNLDPDITVLKMDGDHFWETTPPQLACENDLKTQENLDANKKPFVTITEISLRTQPSEVPPPSRPPPKLTIKQGSRKDLKSSQKNARQGTANGSSPTFFDVEVDISSSAAASAAAMKDAMQKAEARLKSAKEMMERKKDGLQHRKKLWMKEDSKGKEKWESGTAHDVVRVKEERSCIKLEREDSDLKGFDGEENKKGLGVSQVAPDLERKPRLFKSSNDNVNKKQQDECRLTREPQQEEVIGEWKAEEQFYELVKKDPAGTVLLNPGHKKSELSSIPTPRVYQNGFDGKTAEILACVSQEKSHEKSEASKGTSAVEEDIKRLEVAKEIWERAEHDEKRKAAQKIYDQEEQERRREKPRKVLEPEQYEKKLRETREHEKEAREREEYEKKLREALEREEYEKKLKLDREREENEKKKKEALLMEENERRQRERREREENERKQEILEREENERRRKEAQENERRIYEKKQEEARQREENERIQKEVREREENEKKLRESRERQETERKLKQAAEDNEKRLKELREREESERRLKEALEKEENERRLKEVREREEYERKLKVVLEKEENERRLKEVREREEYERRLKEVLEKEENERRLKEVLEKEENGRRLKEALEREENERRLKEALEREENERRLKEISEREESERRYRAQREKEESERKLKDLYEREEIERKLKQAAEENESRQKEVHESEEREKLHKETHAREENERRLEACEEKETREWVEDELRGPHDCNESGIRPEAVFEKIPENTKSNSGDPEQETYNTKLKTSQESRATEGYGRITEPASSSSSDHSDNGDNLKENEISSQENENERLRAAHTSSTSYGDEHCEDNQIGVPKTKVDNNEKRSGKIVDAVEESKSPGKEKNLSGTTAREGRTAKEKEHEKERLRKFEEDRQREKEREKDRMAVERVTREARERAYADARERAERAAVERATAEARQRAMAEARERLEKACAEAREKSLAEKAYSEARLRAERAAVERATAEARERAVEKAMADRAAMEARERVERTVSEKFSATSRDNGLRHSASFSDIRDAQFQSSSSFSGSQRYTNSSNYSAFGAEKSQGNEVESAQRCKARLERHQRTVERAAKALADKNLRDYQTQREQAERHRLAETLDADVKRWSSGKEGNLRALLSTLQYILGPESHWQPVPLTEVITAAAVKKAYRKATLCVHPDKLQQRGASIQQKYICEKVFDLLKDAWNKFNSEER